jgi:hypothetical protein
MPTLSAILDRHVSDSSSDTGLHPVCWMFRASDGSLQFGLSYHFTVAGTGTAIMNEDRELISLELSDLRENHPIG